MRFVRKGDKIYLFGFSRGAYTAKFLARVVNTVGLLCKGNAEMVPFAYRLYQRYLAGEVKDFLDSKEAEPAEHTAGCTADEAVKQFVAPAVAAGEGDAGGETAEHSEEYHVALNEVKAFSDTFCRSEESVDCDGETKKGNIKVYFLGMWDCVNSVAVLERKAPVPVPVVGTAKFVRHAVSVDERRVKFKPALLAQDKRASYWHGHEDIKEVWFPGCHGDVGGGWPADNENPLDTHDEGRMTWRRRVERFWTTRTAGKPSEDAKKDPFQMSDCPLAWMIREVDLVGEQDPSAGVKWFGKHKGDFQTRFQTNKEHAMLGWLHDALNFRQGTGFLTVLLWKIMGAHRPFFPPYACFYVL
ncbi:DUF2235 domain-containing protein [Candidatus Bathyarchaeota archaeon]|nr:DUF2235 domain-containing protein [Candidatus Bathyarchaeota archaeon]